MTNRISMSVLAVVLATCMPLVAAEKKVRVVTTTMDFGVIAREIGGDRADVTALAQPAEDPHFVTPKPSHMVKLAKAEVLVEGGAELEVGWLPPLLDGARNPKLALGQAGHVACAEGMTLLEVPHTADRSRGDVHAMGNPHYMTDPECARHAAEKICNAFSSVDPGHSAGYAERLNSFTNRLESKLVEWQKRLEPFRGQRVVAFHNSWQYFAARFGLKIDIFLEPKPGIPPTPAHLADVIGMMNAEKVKVIIMEPHQNRKTAENVAAKTGATVVEFCQYPGGVKGAEGGYIELIGYLVGTLADAFEKAQKAGGGKP